VQLATRSVGFPNSERGCSESYYCSISLRLNVPRALSYAPNGGLQGEGDGLIVGSRYSWRMHDMV
jgi:hypothetical protein